MRTMKRLAILTAAAFLLTSCAGVPEPETVVVTSVSYTHLTLPTIYSV